VEGPGVKARYEELALSARIIPMGRACDSGAVILSAWDVEIEPDRQIDLCSLWLLAAPKVATKEYSRSSFGLRQDIQTDIMFSSNNYLYICPGAVLIAARHVGVPTWRISNHDRNEIIGISAKR
jgi:hypothetical protein